MLRESKRSLHNSIMAFVSLLSQVTFISQVSDCVYDRNRLLTVDLLAAVYTGVSVLC
jgi:hypothetical protein